MPSTDPLPDANLTLPAPPRSTVITFGDYDALDEIGEGGMGRVYKAVDRNLGRLVAVKVLRSTDPFECSRFRGEAELIATLEHPNIVQIYAIDTTPDGHPYLVLEYAEGGSLDRELGGRPQEPRRAAEMMETIARAVQYAHEKGVIHRDLKPANVLRSKDKVLKLTDFGLAKEMDVSSGMTPSGAVMGTPSYMSPEQAEGKVKVLGPTTDVYGLGAIMYEMLTGRPPFRGVNMADTLEQVRWAEPAPPTRLAPRLPRDLSTICLKCLQKSPARRYQTAGELADDLRRWLNGETITARPAPSWERLWRHVRRRPWEAATVATSFLLVALLIGGLVRHSRQQDRDRAQRELSATEEAAALKFRQEQDENARRLRDRGAKSLAALNAIHHRVLEGDLKRTPGLHGLRGDLANYYKQYIEESLGTDPSADRPGLANLAYQIGELALEGGQLDTAEWLFAKARTLYTELAGADPAYRPRAGDAAVKMARVLYDRNRDDAALRTCAEAERLWRGAGAANRRARDHAELQLGELEHIRGEVLRRRYDIPGACEAFTRSIAHRQKIAADYLAMPADKIGALEDPAERGRAVRYLRELGRGYGYRGDEYLRLRQVSAADRDYWDSHTIREKVAGALAAPKTPEERAESEAARFQLGRSWMNLAGLQTRQRAYATARHFAETAIKLREELFAASKYNTEYRTDYVTNLTELAELALLEGQNKVEERLRLAIEVGRAGATDGPLPFSLEEALAGAHALRAEACADTARETAVADAKQALAFFDRAREQYPDHAGYRFQRATMLALTAEFAGAPPADPRWAEALAELKVALVEKGYRDTPPEDVRKRRYFKALESDPRFRELFDGLRP